MPESPEVIITSQYLLTKLKNRIVKNMEILSGKYKRIHLQGKEFLDGTLDKTNEYQIKNIDSKGKLLWFSMEKTSNPDDKLFLVSHFGLTGGWSFHSSNDSDRIKITIINSDNDKKYYLYYNDPRNFGNIFITDNYQKLEIKINNLAPDFLKTEFTEQEFVNKFHEYVKKSKKRSQLILFKLLMNQTKTSGIGSGIGNYLAPEILYEAKLSPYRQLNSLTNQELSKLAYSIKYIMKLSYYNNSTGYMTNFGEFTEIHRQKIDSGFYPNYHPEIILKSTDKFEFKVYRKEKDPLGNIVQKDKSYAKNRSIYWVPNVQK